MSDKEFNSNTASSSRKVTMADLMASHAVKPLSLNRGDEVSGKVLAINDTEVIVDLGTKSEGFLEKREFSGQQLDDLKVGDKIAAYVVATDNQSERVLLSLQKQLGRVDNLRPGFEKKWQKFLGLLQNKNLISGTVTEVNKKGIIIEIDKIRGFLPLSQLSFETLMKMGTAEKLEGLVGQEMSVYVIEVDPSNRRLIFSQRAVNISLKEALARFQQDQKVGGQVVAVMPFGVTINLDPLGDLGTNGVEGIIFSHETSWGGGEEALREFKVGQSIEAVVTGRDEEAGRVNLSVRKMTEDPFEKLAEKYETDDVIKGTVSEVIPAGVVVKLGEGIEGFIPAAKIESGTVYSAGEEISALVDGVDKNKRRVNLAPFLTSTKGLIYR